MGSLENITYGAILVSVFGYVTNFMGFRDWASATFPGLGPVIPPVPPETPQPGENGTGGATKAQCTATCKSKYPGRTPRVADGKCFCDVPKTTVAVPCVKQCADKFPGRTPRVTGGKCFCDAPKPTVMTLANCNSQCASKYPGRVPRVSSNTCYCDPPKRPTTCPPCQSCFVPTGVGCGCKINPLGIAHSDPYCKTSCSGVSCWTNYPCPNRGAKAQKCVKGSCAQARAAFLAAYGCGGTNARVARAYEAFDDELVRVPSLA